VTILKIPITEKDHIQGNPNAPITLVEYGDYECPVCGSAYPIVKRIQQDFGDKLRLVFRNFPLVEQHPHAELAAETAEFAAIHKRFWEAHDLLYENQDHLDLPFMIELAEGLKLPVSEYREALENRTFEAKVRTDFLGGVRSGVNGTPTFFINGQRHNGSFYYEDLAHAISQALHIKI
jgi:protein-disulfide isomerase